MYREEAEFLQALGRERAVSHYITSTPFSTIDNANYGGKLTRELFQRLFFVNEGVAPVRDAFYECLADTNLNAFLLFGYKGCGKTVFVNCLTDYIDGKKIGSRTIICSVIDFEKEREWKVDSKFKMGLIRLIKRCINGYNASHERDRESLQKKKDCLLSVYGCAAGIIAECEVEQELSSFVDKYGRMPAMTTNESMQELEGMLRDMTEASLLLVATFLLLCEDMSMLGHADVKHVIVFDNLDDELDETVVSQFIGAFEGYSAAYASVFNELRNLKVPGYDTSNCGFYDNFMFVFCLRDTNVPKFSAHMQDRILHHEYNMSEALDRQLALERKLDYLKHIEQDAQVKRQALVFESSLLDRYIFDRVFPLFNGGFRTAVNAISKAMSGENYSLAQEYTELVGLGRGHSSIMFGAHGIMMRLICDLFRENNYLLKIGAESEELSVPRIMLTLLYNKARGGTAALLQSSDSILLLDLKAKMQCLDVSNVRLAASINSMYALFEKRYWSHLIEVSSWGEVNVSALDMELSTGVRGKRETEVQITDAGRMFVSTLSSHFEYFASRYNEASRPLFSRESLLTNAGVRGLEESLDLVLSKVESCVGTVKRYDQKICERLFDGDIDRYFRSDYVFKVPETGVPQTHAERIIMHHISYLEAYRQFVLSVSAPKIDLRRFDPEYAEKIVVGCEQLENAVLTHIKGYLKLLEDFQLSGYITPLGQSLLRGLSRKVNRVENGERDVVINMGDERGY